MKLKMQNCELYIYLGRSEGVGPKGSHFFIHTLRNENSNYILESGQIYNAMIQESMIGKENKVFILTIVHTETIMICIQHTSFTFHSFDLDNLTSTALRLIRAPRDLTKMMTISYDGECYKMYENVDCSKVDFKSVDRVTIDSIEYVTTCKDIPYL